MRVEDMGEGRREGVRLKIFRGGGEDEDEGDGRAFDSGENGAAQD